MRSLVVLALAGAAAQLVDGSLGMAYGVTSSTLLLMVGLTPAVASASVHFAEIGTTLTSGLSHWKFGNIDWSKIAWLALPGAVGAFLGASVLTSIPGDVAKPIVSTVLLALGLYILLRFATDRRPAFTGERPVASGALAPLGLFAGFIDAVGGGGWGPIGTSTLLASRRMEPRKVIGTISASEFLVTLSASAGFLIGLDRSEIPFRVVGALLVGGVLAAPLAALVVKRMDARILGAFVGGLIVLVNVRTFLEAVGLDGLVSPALYGTVLLVWASAVGLAVSRTRRERQEVAARLGEPVTSGSRGE